MQCNEMYESKSVLLAYLKESVFFLINYSLLLFVNDVRTLKILELQVTMNML